MPTSAPESRCRERVAQLFTTMGVEFPGEPVDQTFPSRSPIDNGWLANLNETSPEELHKVADRARSAFHKWRTTSFQERSDLLRQLGLQLERHKKAIAELVAIETGKPIEDAMLEIRQAIEFFDLSCLVPELAQESCTNMPRRPLGSLAIVTPFNFPLATWARSASYGLMAGNSIVWKPSEYASLSAIACHALVDRTLADTQFGPLSQLIVGGLETGRQLSKHSGFQLVEITGTTRACRAIKLSVSERLDRTILHGGGNAGCILSETANLDLALPFVLRSSLFHAGQGCNNIRRLIVHESVADRVRSEVLKTFENTSSMDPLNKESLMGPLINESSAKVFSNTIQTSQNQGATIHWPGANEVSNHPNNFVSPCLIEIGWKEDVIQHECRVPILYLSTFSNFEKALTLLDSVPQKRMSALFSNESDETAHFLSIGGSQATFKFVNRLPDPGRLLVLESTKTRLNPYTRFEQQTKNELE